MVSLTKQLSGNGQIRGNLSLVTFLDRPSSLTSAAVQRETFLTVFLLPEHQCLLLKQYIEDIYGVIMPRLPVSYNANLEEGTWDLTRKYANCEEDFKVYERLAVQAAKSMKTVLKLQKTQHKRMKQLEYARDRYTAASISGHGKFVSIDVECYEMDHQCVTELGIGTMRFPDGEIHTEHFLVRDYAHLRNGRFVPDMSTAFNHGTSQWIELKECGKYIHRALKGDTFEPVYLVGHDPLADIKYLERNLKCRVPPGVIIFDTRLMFSAWGGDNTLRKLSTCLEELDFDFWNLHNAGMTFYFSHLMIGNDAHYTLMAFKAMCEREKKSERRESSPELIDFIEDPVLPLSPGRAPTDQENKPRTKYIEPEVEKRPRRRRRKNKNRSQDTQNSTDVEETDEDTSVIRIVSDDTLKGKKRSKSLTMGIGLTRGPPLNKAFPPLPPTGPLPEPPVGVEPWTPPKSNHRRARSSLTEIQIDQQLIELGRSHHRRC